MDVKLNQVIYHLLDSGASEPVLSDRPMDLDADLFEYFTACIEKAWASDEGKACQFLPDSAFLAEMRQNSDFIDLSRRIAGVIFEQQLQYPGIPSGDLAVADCSMDGVPFYAVLKLNYRPGYTTRQPCWATASAARSRRSAPCCQAAPRPMKLP